MDIIDRLKDAEKNIPPEFRPVIHDAWREIMRLRESHKVCARAVEIAEAKSKETA